MVSDLGLSASGASVQAGHVDDIEVHVVDGNSVQHTSGRMAQRNRRSQTIGNRTREHSVLVLRAQRRVGLGERVGSPSQSNQQTRCNSSLNVAIVVAQVKQFSA